MRLAAWPAAATVLAFSSAPWRRLPPISLGIFPDDADGRPSEEQGGSLFPDVDGGGAMQQPPELTREGIIGFWTIFDEQATEDTLNDMAAGGASKTSLFSAPLILRADGRTSRGSDFPGGEWSMNEVTSEDGSTRKRLSITLRSNLLRQEWRYEGLLFALAIQDEPPPMEGMPPMPKLIGETSQAGKPQVRVVGKATRWDISDRDAPQALGGETSFSMVRKEVDRRKLTPTIKPLSSIVDPDDVRLQNEWRRLKERSEEEEIRRAIDEVKKSKDEYGKGWLEADRLKEGVDYWKVGEEPGAKGRDGPPPQGGASSDDEMAP